MLGVLLAVFALAVGSAGLGNVDLKDGNQHLSYDFPYAYYLSWMTAEHATRAGEYYMRA